MKMPQVYSKRKGAAAIPPDAVYVGRGTPWGNPFQMTHESENACSIGSRAWACTEFEKYAAGRLEREPAWLAPLRGRDLVCWCQSPEDLNPKRCHAQTLIRLANAERTP